MGQVNGENKASPIEGLACFDESSIYQDKKGDKGTSHVTQMPKKAYDDWWIRPLRYGTIIDDSRPLENI